MHVAGIKFVSFTAQTFTYNWSLAGRGEGRCPAMPPALPLTGTMDPLCYRTDWLRC